MWLLPRTNPISHKYRRTRPLQRGCHRYHVCACLYVCRMCPHVCTLHVDVHAYTSCIHANMGTCTHSACTQRARLSARTHQMFTIVHALGKKKVLTHRMICCREGRAFQDGARWIVSGLLRPCRVAVGVADHLTLFDLFRCYALVSLHV